MIPLMIGNDGRPLHAVYTAPTGKRQRRAVVFCPPFGLEYERTHRAGRLLAQRLAAAGAETVRFDYYGTGDSAGEDDEFSAEGAVQDALAVIDEAKDLGNVRRVTVVGMRRGAHVALQAAALARGVDRLVLWDPVVDELPATALPRDTLVVVCEQSLRHQQLGARLAELSPRVSLEVLPSAPPWVSVGDDGVGAAPVDALARIAGWDP